MERIWLKYYPAGVPAAIDVGKYSSIVALLEESFSLYRARQAYVCMDKAITYRDIDPLSTALAAWLQSKGLQRGARVAIMMPNVLQYPVAIAAILRAGFAVVNVNPLYTPRELEHQLNDAGAEAIVVLENFAHVASGAREDHGQARGGHQHGRHAGRQGHDRQSGGAQREENGPGLFAAGRDRVQRCACRRPQPDVDASRAQAR